MIQLACHSLGGIWTASILSSSLWVARGGTNWDGSIAGVFHFSRNNGWGNTETSFRSVLSAVKLWIKDSQKMFFQNTKSRFLNKYLYHNPLKFSSNLLLMSYF